MENWHARPKAPSSRRTKSSTSLNEQSETSSQKGRNKYNDKNCQLYLQTKGSFLYGHETGISSASRAACEELLTGAYEPPKGTKFDDHVFFYTCMRLQEKNEATVIRKIADLIVPSAVDAIDRGLVKFKGLTESVNESWDNSLSLDAAQQPLPPRNSQSTPLPPPPRPQVPKLPRFQLPRPQPDFTVGFPRGAFTEEQLATLAPLLGEIGDTSFFMSTAEMHFPFLTSEVKGKAALDIADHQNAHSMTLAVRGVVELFKIVKREKELHQEILGFSISHDYCSVRIYGHYPIIDGGKITYYRHTLRKFDFTELNGRDKWATYKFTMSVYNDWVPSHFKRLCSAIDMIPQMDFEVSQQAEGQSEASQPEVSELVFLESNWTFTGSRSRRSRL